MASTDIASATTTNLTSALTDYSVDTKQTDGVYAQDETFYYNTNFTKWFGYYKQIPELKKAIDALATWTLGKGYDADPEVIVILENMIGWGEDTFNSIMWNMLTMKKINGDAYAEIIRDPDSGELLNLKPLDPASMVNVVDRKGIIKRYEQRSKTKDGKTQKFEPRDILHLVNDRVADEIHGVSVVEACENVILARNEAISDWKTVLRRNVNPLKIWYVDTDNTTKINALITKIETTVKDKENIVVPYLSVPKVDVIQSALVAPLDWIKYLEDFFYQALGVPKVILGGSSEFTEASAKIAYLTFEQIYAREQIELEKDLWNQIQIRISFRKPASLSSEMLTSDYKNQSQTGFQPNDVMAGSGK